MSFELEEDNVSEYIMSGNQDPTVLLEDFGVSAQDLPYGMLDLIDETWENSHNFFLPDVEDADKQPVVKTDNSISVHNFFPELDAREDDQSKWVEEWMTNSIKQRTESLGDYLLPNSQFVNYPDNQYADSSLNTSMFQLLAHRHVLFSWLCPFPSCRQFHVVDTVLFPVLSQHVTKLGNSGLYQKQEGFHTVLPFCCDDVVYPTTSLSPLYPCKQVVPYLLPFLHSISRLNRLSSLTSQTLSSSHNLLAFILGQYIETCSLFQEVYVVSPSMSEQLNTKEESLVSFFQTSCVTETLPSLRIPTHSSVLLALSMAMEPSSPCHAVDMPSTLKIARAVIDTQPVFMHKLGNITSLYQQFVQHKPSSVYTDVKKVLQTQSNVHNLQRALVSLEEIMDTNLFSCQGGTLVYSTTPGTMHLLRFHIDSLFARIAMMEHSCLSNAMLQEQHQDAYVDIYPTTPCVQSSFFVLKTLHAVPKNTPLSISYRFISNLSLGQRRRETKQHYNFHCQCVLCSGIDRTRMYYIIIDKISYTCSYHAKTTKKNTEIDIYLPSGTFPTVSDPVIATSEEYTWCVAPTTYPSKFTIPTRLFFVLEYMMENIPQRSIITQFSTFLSAQCEAQRHLVNLQDMRKQVKTHTVVPLFHTDFQGIPVYTQFQEELANYARSIGQSHVSMHVSSTNAIFLSILSKAVGKIDAFFGLTMPQYTYSILDNKQPAKYPNCTPFYTFLQLHFETNDIVSLERVFPILIWMQAVEQSQYGDSSWVLVDTSVCLAEAHFLQANAYLTQACRQLKPDDSLYQVYHTLVFQETTLHQKINTTPIASTSEAISQSTQWRMQGLAILEQIQTHIAMDLDKRRAIQNMITQHKSILTSLALYTLVHKK